MTDRSHRTLLVLTASAAALLLTAGASAQETPAQARARAATQSLNGGPSETTLGLPPAAPPAPSVQAPRPTQTRDLDRTLEDLLGAFADEAEPEDAATPAVTLAEGETEPAPIPVALGYYVRGDKDCDQVWPGEGDLAFMTPTTFTIDFGGCAPGQFLQTGPNSWREEQSCRTELGGDAGSYVVDYEMVETGTLRRTARLEIDSSVEQDTWRFCEIADVPENARFGS
ncbi:hypothetical protein [Brevundimonas aurifodinae]|uniref:Uncharacterized protein n=2 Tax=Brevundimonas TaxID=41275 RepID=A0ABV1NM18_9CAUL|nr:MAG: hypothetical protein B7Z42_08535 [Brevundimonas sp. 12-68-7]OYX32442.1 MAG: hypothetical protein B7Z01_11020 [Brevundimonas subvibrioides]